MQTKNNTNTRYNIADKDKDKYKDTDKDKDTRLRDSPGRRLNSVRYNIDKMDKLRQLI